MYNPIQNDNIAVPGNIHSTYTIYATLTSAWNAHQTVIGNNSVAYDANDKSYIHLLSDIDTDVQRREITTNGNHSDVTIFCDKHLLSSWLNDPKYNLTDYDYCDLNVSNERLFYVDYCLDTENAGCGKIDYYVTMDR